jgi:hypothetical protein
MKIIQSFWTLPMVKSEATTMDNRLSGGWLDLKYHLMSWAYSCLQLRSFYDEVELITDRAGKDLLIDMLHLPYTRTTVVLDAINHYNPNWWAIGKIYAFSLQERPFLHVDGDVFIWEPFPERLEKAALVSQNLEYGYPFYKEVLDHLLDREAYVPTEILSCARGQSSLHAYNAGIIGGNDIAFFKEYVLEAWKFIKKNHTVLDVPNAGRINAFYEQHLLFCMAARRKIKVECYTDEIDQDRLWTYFKSQKRFRNAPEDCRYIHLFGEDVKKWVEVCEVLSDRLRREYPAWHNRVMSTISTHYNKYQYDDNITDAAGDMAQGL